MFRESQKEGIRLGNLSESDRFINLLSDIKILTPLLELGIQFTEKVFKSQDNQAWDQKKNPKQLELIPEEDADSYI